MSQRIEQQAKLQDYKTLAHHYDLFGRRTSKNDEQYGYNARDELTSADEVSYNYDDIGNRTTAEGKTYTSNNLNQYTAIDDFAPQYDADGNQTLIKTETGIWVVVYNAENRPIRWESGDTVITMAFDRMGRRIEMRTVKDGAETLQRFVYDNYLCIQQLRTASNALFQSYVWDPTEPIATRPLIFIPSVGEIAYYFHDGNKNVSDLVALQGDAVHYSYVPFGAPTVSAPSENPYNFSSEVYDNTIGLIYYNYRHYNSKEGRWNRRDPLANILPMVSPYCFIGNSVGVVFDVVGLFGEDGHKDMPEPVETSKKDCQFPNFNEEDRGWTNPWLQPWLHFRPLEGSESDLGRAVSDCDVEAFESYAHQMQDYFSHYGQGYRWWLGGHVPDSFLAWLFGFARPDNLDDFEDAHKQAKSRTQAWVNKWEKCCCCSSGKWVAKSGRDEGACGTGVDFPIQAAPPKNGLMPNIFPRSGNTNAPSILPPDVEVTFPIFDPNYRPPRSVPSPDSDWERGTSGITIMLLRF